MSSISNRNFNYINRIRKDKEALTRNATQGRFQGTTFVSGSEIAAQNEHKRSLSTIDAQGKSDLAVQNAANKGSLDVANIRDKGMTSRQDSLSKVAEKNTDAAMAAQKKKDWMGVYSKLTSPTYDEAGAQTSPGMKGQDAIDFMNNQETAYDNYINPPTSKPKGSAYVQTMKSGDQYTLNNGTIDRQTTIDRASNRMNKTFSNTEELRKKSAVLKKSKVFKRPQDIGNRTFSLRG